jgi:hypothetical protein
MLSSTVPRLAAIRPAINIDTINPRTVIVAAIMPKLPCAELVI